MLPEGPRGRLGELQQKRQDCGGHVWPDMGTVRTATRRTHSPSEPWGSAFGFPSWGASENPLPMCI